MEYQADVRPGGGMLSQIATLCAPLNALRGGSVPVGTEMSYPPPPRPQQTRKPPSKSDFTPRRKISLQRHPDRLLEQIARMFGIQAPLPNLAPNWNVAPTQRAAVVRRHPESGERTLDLLTWGFVPHFTNDLKACKRPINARAETVASSGMFRSALASRRCLVPADAFYEWRAMAHGKQPYAIARAEGEALAFAGLWEGWRDPAGEVLRSFTIVTTEANAEMSKLHNRMPVILEPEAWPAWLGEEKGAPAELLRPAADGTLRLWCVSRAVNNVRNNGPDLLDAIDEPRAPPLSNAPPGENPA
jgi:putative SOS response-associated peptidase YedK